jgi:hypothetical protein
MAVDHQPEQAAQATATFADRPEIVRLTPPISGGLIRARGLRPDSAQTNGNLVDGTTCRNTDEFPVLATAALIGPF